MIIIVYSSLPACHSQILCGIRASIPNQCPSVTAFVERAVRIEERSMTVAIVDLIMLHGRNSLKTRGRTSHMVGSLCGHELTK